jgi:hypothetical protein
LKEFWEHNRFLNDAQTNGELLGLSYELRPLREAVQMAMPELNKFRFIPLVCGCFDLLCRIDVLMLRRDEPRRGGIFDSRDLDNRLKVIFDALKMPKDMPELGEITPGEGENPLYVLVQSDDLISQVSIETGTLLAPPHPYERADSYVHLLIDVTIWPQHAWMQNLSYVGG